MRTFKLFFLFLSMTIFFACSEDDKKSENKSKADNTGGKTVEERKKEMKPILSDGGLIEYIDFQDLEGKSSTKLEVDHPIQIVLKVRPDKDFHDIFFHVGLVEKHDKGADHKNIHTCEIGSWKQHITKTETEETGDDKGLVIIKRTLVVNSKCLAKGKDKMVFNLWVSQNPALHEIHKSDDEGNVADGDYNTQFFNADMIDTEGGDRNKKCKGKDGKEGCIFDLTLEKSSGIEAHLEDFSLESKVFTLPKNCEHSFGDPGFETNLSLKLYGGSSFDHETEGQNPKAAKLDDKPNFVYSLCPRSADGQCMAGEKYVELGVFGHEEAKTAKDPKGAAEIKALNYHSSHVFNHDLHFVKDSKICKAFSDSKWHHHALFNLKACVDIGKKSSASDSPENNCRILPVLVVEEHESTGSALNKSFAFNWGKTGGNSVINGSVGINTNSAIGLSGATTNNKGFAKLGGWFSKDIFNIWLNAQAYVALVGSGYDGGLDFMGSRYWSAGKKIEEIEITEEKKFSKRICMRYNYGIAGIGLNVEFCASGSAGIKATGTLSAKEGAKKPFDSATKIGEIDLVVTPSGSIGLSASAYLNLLVVKGGITGSVSLVTASMPATGKVQWGLIVQNSKPALAVNYSAGVDFSLSFLTGNVFVWVKLPVPKWCHCGSWCPGYPCISWRSVVNENICSFSAYHLTKNLYKKSSGFVLQ